MKQIGYARLDNDTSAIIGDKVTVLRIWIAFKKAVEEAEEEE